MNRERTIQKQHGVNTSLGIDTRKPVTITLTLKSGTIRKIDARKKRLRNLTHFGKS